MHNSRKSEKRGRGSERERFVRDVRERDLLNKRSTLLQKFLSTTRRGKTKEGGGEMRQKDLLKTRKRDLLNKRSTLLQQFLSTTRRGKKG